MEDSSGVSSGKTISRGDFLKSAGAFLAAAFIPLPTPSSLEKYLSKGYAKRYTLDELKLGPYMGQLLKSLQQLSFDDSGNLLLHNNTIYDLNGAPNNLSEESVRINTFATKYNEEHNSQTDKVKEVDFLVLHWDGAPRVNTNGKIRTAGTTLNGLNNGNKVSVQFCVDELPIAPNGEVIDISGYYPGYGILQTQRASGELAKPYLGNHVAIEPIDTARGSTLNSLVKYDLHSDISNLENKPFYYVNQHSIGIEMVGEYYDSNFPSQFPPMQHVSNTLSLVFAIANTYNLSPWDVVGHHEIQEKMDPGDLFMFLTRYGLGVGALTGVIPSEQVFSKDNPDIYFSSLISYFKDREKQTDPDSALQWLEINPSPVPSPVPSPYYKRYC